MNDSTSSSSAGGNAAFCVTFLILSILGIFSAVSQAQAMSFMTVIPDSRYMTLFSFAMGASAILQNVIRAVTLVYFETPSNERDESQTQNGVLLSTIVFYSVSAIVMLIASSMYFIERNCKLS